jgi:hypothetical protein
MCASENEGEEEIVPGEEKAENSGSCQSRC